MATKTSGTVTLTMTEISLHFTKFSILDMIAKTAVITGHKLREDSGRSLDKLALRETISPDKERVTIEWRVK